MSKRRDQLQENCRAPLFDRVARDIASAYEVGLVEIVAHDQLIWPWPAWLWHTLAHTRVVRWRLWRGVEAWIRMRPQGEGR